MCGAVRVTVIMDYRLQWAMWQPLLDLKFYQYFNSLLSYAFVLHKVMIYSCGVKQTVPPDCTGSIMRKIIP
jgi:hypothetical protein